MRLGFAFLGCTKLLVGTNALVATKIAKRLENTQ